MLGCSAFLESSPQTLETSRTAKWLPTNKLYFLFNCFDVTVDGKDSGSSPII